MNPARGTPLATSVATIELPPPRRTAGPGLRRALARRRSTREFADRPLTATLLSDLLWSAAGINRPETGGRTSPSARDAQEIAIHVVMAEGSFLYEPVRHRLRPMVRGDLRALTGTQPFAARAPVTFVYVAETTMMAARDEQERRFYAAADAAFMAQNVYLFCAGEGLGTVVRGLIDRPALARALGLRSTQRVVLAQSVGHPLHPIRG